MPVGGHFGIPLGQGQQMVRTLFDYVVKAGKLPLVHLTVLTHFKDRNSIVLFQKTER